MSRPIPVLTDGPRVLMTGRGGQEPTFGGLSFQEEMVRKHNQHIEAGSSESSPMLAVPGLSGRDGERHAGTGSRAWVPGGRPAKEQQGQWPWARLAGGQEGPCLTTQRAEPLAP